MTKVCKYCRRQLDSSMFKPSQRTGDGLQVYCIVCAEKNRLKARERYTNDLVRRTQKLQSQRDRYHRDPGHKQSVNKTRAMNLLRQYHKDPHLKETVNKRRAKNLLKQYHTVPSFKQSVNKRRAKNLLKQYHQDPIYRIHVNISSQIRQSLIDGKQGQSWELMVGFTLADLVRHLESQFQEGMTWDNYGEWHIDHRVPKSWYVFESVNDPEFKECWKLDNLKPMWGPENISKGNRSSD